MTWEHFKGALRASIGEIKPVYFLVPRYAEQPVLRERVYCYELYHQLRCHLGDNYEFTVHAEIDKRGQEIVAEKVGPYTNPDFMVHIPGAGLDHEFQLAVIEVKTTAWIDLGKIETDLNKLRVYVEEVGYQRGVFLVFGLKNRRKVKNLLENIHIPPNVSVFWHYEVGAQPRIFESEVN